MNNKEVINSLKERKISLSRCTDEQKLDKEVVITAIKNWLYELEDIDNSFFNDLDVMKELVKKDCKNFTLIGEDLKTEKNIKKLINANILAVGYSNNILKDTKYLTKLIDRNLEKLSKESLKYLVFNLLMNSDYEKSISALYQEGEINSEFMLRVNDTVKSIMEEREMFAEIKINNKTSRAMKF